MFVRDGTVGRICKSAPTVFVNLVAHGGWVCAEPPQPPRQASPATPPQEGNVLMQILFQQSHASPPLPLS